MIPHTPVLKPGLIIHSICNGYWLWGRPSVIDLRHHLRAVTSEIRPDWDLSAPELREAWNAGARRDGFQCSLSFRRLASVSAYHCRGSVHVCSIVKPASSNKAPNIFRVNL